MNETAITNQLLAHESIKNSMEIECIKTDIRKIRNFTNKKTFQYSLLFTIITFSLYSLVKSVDEMKKEIESLKKGSVIIEEE